jgi:O-antigen/teichoic acid export membrane protein
MDEGGRETRRVTGSPAELSAGVLRSGAWGIAGQAVVLLAALAATPIVVRLLAPELYGLLALIESIIQYLAFTNLGMTAATTRFGAAAYARSDDDGEVAVVWTALSIAAVPSVLAIMAVWLLAPWLVREVFRLGPHLRPTGASALRISTISFGARVVSGCLNTSQLVRLRWDLYTKINAGGSVLQVATVPVVLALGGGLIGAVTVEAVVSGAVAILNLAASWRLQRRLIRLQVRAALIAPLARFGGAMVIASVAAIPLMNIERFFLARFASVRAVAFYSVAATLAMLLTILPIAVCQPLLPAFTRLYAHEEREELGRLYRQSLRAILLISLPAALVLCVVARTVLTVWAGPLYGRESTVPFYILAFGLTLGSLNYIPKSLLQAAGKPGVIARYQSAELLPYLLVSAGLTYRYGAVGAALGWSLRMVLDALVFLAVASRVTAVSSRLFGGRFAGWLLTSVALVVPFVAAEVLTSSLTVHVATAVIALAAYLLAAWGAVLSQSEQEALRKAWSNARARLPHQRA